VTVPYNRMNEKMQRINRMGKIVNVEPLTAASLLTVKEFNAGSSSEEYPEAVAQALTVEQAIANLNHLDLESRYYAAWWLGKFRRTPPAVDGLIMALEDETDRTLGGYPLRRMLLGRWADGRSTSRSSADPLFKLLRLLCGWRLHNLWKCCVTQLRYHP